MTKVVECDTCGAPMLPTSDGRVFRCDYCASEKQVAIDERQLAAGLRLDLTNVEAFVLGLATSLQQALPQQTRVLHEGTQLVLLELTLDPHLFLTKREARGGFTAQYKKLVRGVALKTKTLPLDQWVAELTKSMADHANQNAHVARVLAQLRGA